LLILVHFFEFYSGFFVLPFRTNPFSLGSFHDRLIDFYAWDDLSILEDYIHTKRVIGLRVPDRPSSGKHVTRIQGCVFRFGCHPTGQN
jgi:hypothetical protein